MSADKTDLDVIFDSSRLSALIVPESADRGDLTNVLQVRSGLSSELNKLFQTNEAAKTQAMKIALRQHLAWACGIFRASSNWEIDFAQHQRLTDERDELNEAAGHWIAERLPLTGYLEKAAEGLLVPLAHFEHNAGNWTRAKLILERLMDHLEIDAKSPKPEMTLARRSLFSAQANLLIARQAAHERDMNVAAKAVEAAIQDAQNCEQIEVPLLLLEARLRQAMAQMDWFEQNTQALPEEENSPSENEFLSVTKDARTMRAANDVTARSEENQLELSKIEISAYGYLAELKLKRSTLCDNLKSLNFFLEEAKICLDYADPLIYLLHWERPRAHHLRLRGDICRLSGEWEEARVKYLESLEVAQRSGNQDKRLYGWNYLGLAEIEQEPQPRLYYVKKASRSFDNPNTFPNEWRRAQTLKSYCSPCPSPRIFFTGAPASGKTTARERICELLKIKQWENIVVCGMEEALREQLPTPEQGSNATDYHYEEDGALILADNARERLLMNAVALFVQKCFDADATGDGFLAEVGHPNPFEVLLVHFRPLLRGTLILHMRAGREERKRRNKRRLWRVPEQIVSSYEDQMGDKELHYLERSGATIKVFDASEAPTIERLLHHIEYLMEESLWGRPCTDSVT